LNQGKGGVDGDNVKKPGVPRMQLVKTDVKNIWNKVRVREENINNYHMTLRNIPEERRSHQHHEGSLKLK
jgi:hypothetical protein